MKNFIYFLIVVLGSTSSFSQIVDVNTFDKENATNAFELAMKSNNDSIFFDFKNSPYILKPMRFRNVKNKTIILEDGVEFKAMLNAFQNTNDALIKFINCENISILGNGGKLSMNKSEYTTGEWRHVISIRGSRNIVISDLLLRDSGGDGIAIGRSNETLYSKDIYLNNIRCINNKRQGISIMSAENVWVTNSCFAYTGGTAPGAGVDLEPNIAEERMVNINFKNCEFKNNYYAGINIGFPKLTSKSIPVSVIFDSCLIENNFYTQFHKVPAEIIIRSNQVDPVKGTVVFKNCIVANSNWRMLYARKNETGFHVTFEDCVVKNICNNPKSGSPLYFEVPHYTKQSDFGGYHFENLMLQYNSRKSPLLVRGARKNPLSNLKNTTGTIFVDNPYVPKIPIIEYIGYSSLFNENVTLRIKKQLD